MSSDYRPREHDHLVEPMFGGLGVERRGAEGAQRRPGLLARLLRSVLRLVFPSRPAAGP